MFITQHEASIDLDLSAALCVNDPSFEVIPMAMFPRFNKCHAHETTE